MAKELSIKDIEKSNDEIAKELSQLREEVDKATAEIESLKQIIAHPESVEDVQDITDARSNKQMLEDKISVLRAKIKKRQTPEDNSATFCAIERARADAKNLYETEVQKHVDAIGKLTNEFEVRDSYYTSLYDRRRALLCNTKEIINLPAIYTVSGIYNSTRNYVKQIESHNQIKK